MKQDYLVLWSELAEAKLLDKADYIYHDSQDESVAERFLETMRSMAEKLSFVVVGWALAHHSANPQPQRG